MNNPNNKRNLQLRRSLMILSFVTLTRLWLHAEYRHKQLEEQINQLVPFDHTFYAIDKITGDHLPITVDCPQQQDRDFIGIYQSIALSDPIGLHLTWIASKPVTFKIRSDGYTTEQVIIDKKDRTETIVELQKK